MKYPHSNMITWNRLARDLAQMLTTCPLYPSMLGALRRQIIFNKSNLYKLTIKEIIQIYL